MSPGRHPFAQLRPPIRALSPHSSCGTQVGGVQNDHNDQHHDHHPGRGDRRPVGRAGRVMTGDDAPVCTIGDCVRRVRARGLCASHHERWRVHGDVGAGTPVQVRGGCTYDAALRKVTRERGPARDHPCSTDGCDKAAGYWVYGGGDPAERFAEDMGRHFSVDASWYVPRCWWCTFSQVDRRRKRSKVKKGTRAKRGRGGAGATAVDVEYAHPAALTAAEHRALAQQARSEAQQERARYHTILDEIEASSARAAAAVKRNRLRDDDLPVYVCQLETTAAIHEQKAEELEQEQEQDEEETKEQDQQTGQRRPRTETETK